MYIIQNIVPIICLTITWKKEVTIKKHLIFKYLLRILGNLLIYALQFLISKLTCFRVVIIDIILTKRVRRMPDT